MRNRNELEGKSRFLSLVLRHKPETIGISLDEHGWADVGEIITGIGITQEELEEIVKTDKKQRYSFSQDKMLIRANQGHSIPVDVELQKATPPDILYHGTGRRYLEPILQRGLIPKSRLYVHLSKDRKTALKVGKRHGLPVVFDVDCKKMTEDGHEFFLSVNGIRLTKEVPVQYLTRFEEVQYD